MKPVILTRTNKFVDPFDLSKEQIDIDDIAFSLSNISRYNGHVKFYSVAEHSLLLSHYAERLYDKHIALWCLLHDASEAYLGDIPAPIKGRFPKVKETESFIMKLVAEKYKIALEEPRETYNLDKNIILYEAFELHYERNLQRFKRDWEYWKHSDLGILSLDFYLQNHSSVLGYNTYTVNGFLPELAYKSFLNRFEELVNGH